MNFLYHFDCNFCREMNLITIFFSIWETKTHGLNPCVLFFEELDIPEPYDLCFTKKIKKKPRTLGKLQTS